MPCTFCSEDGQCKLWKGNRKNQWWSPNWNVTILHPPSTSGRHTLQIRLWFSSVTCMVPRNPLLTLPPGNQLWRTFPEESTVRHTSLLSGPELECMSSSEIDHWFRELPPFQRLESATGTDYQHGRTHLTTGSHRKNFPLSGRKQKARFCSLIANFWQKGKQ